MIFPTLMILSSSIETFQLHSEVSNSSFSNCPFQLHLTHSVEDCSLVKTKYLCWKIVWKIESVSKWAVQKGESGRSVQKRTVWSQTGLSFERKCTVRDGSERPWVKENGHSTQSRRSFGWIEESKWTVQKCQTGRSDSVQLVLPNPKCTLTFIALTLIAP